MEQGVGELEAPALKDSFYNFISDVLIDTVVCPQGSVGESKQEEKV